KVVLIYNIAKYENITPIGYHNFNWIQFIINHYLKDPESRDLFFKKPPIIYTFNYDRIFERSILKHLVDFHSINKKDATEMVKSLKIKHIYGDLGPFEKAFDYTNPQQVKEAMSRIRVIGEERLKNTASLSNQIFEDLNKLNQVYILGYGYDSLNNE